KHEAPGVRNRLGNPQPFLPEGPALGEQAKLSMAPGEPGIGGHRGQDDLTKALMALPPLEGRHGLCAAVYGPTIVTLELVGYAKVAVRQRVQDDILAGRGGREGALCGGGGRLI